MDKKEVLIALKTAKEQSKERNFPQRIDIIYNFKDLDLKKPDNHIDLFVTLPNAPGKKKRVAGFVDAELVEEAKTNLEWYATPQTFVQYASNIRGAKKLADSYDYFIAQGNIMKDVAGAFGRVFGSRGKMPNPKGGMVVPPKSNLASLRARLETTVHVKIKVRPTYQTGIGSVTQDENEIAENILALHQQLVTHLPNEAANVRSVYLKTTMGKPVKVI